MAKKKQSSFREQVQDKLQSHAENVRDKLSDIGDDTTAYIEENPIKATLVAFGIGVVAGAVILKLLERK